MSPGLRLWSWTRRKRDLPRTDGRDGWTLTLRCTWWGCGTPARRPRRGQGAPHVCDSGAPAFFLGGPVVSWSFCCLDSARFSAAPALPACRPFQSAADPSPAGTTARAPLLLSDRAGLTSRRCRPPASFGRVASPGGVVPSVPKRVTG